MLLAPHSIAWTDELFRDIGRSVCQGMLDLSLGKLPRGVVNPQVFDRPGFQEKWARDQELTSMRRRLEGQTAWISGAASGIGAATARLFAEEGANVALVDIHADRGDDRAEMAAGHGGSAVFIQADVSVEEQVRDSLDEDGRRCSAV